MGNNITDRLKRHLKTLKKLRNKEIVDVYIRKNAFYNHIKDTKESKKLKVDSFLKKVWKIFVNKLSKKCCYGKILLDNYFCIYLR